MSWWNPESNAFDTLWPEETLRKEMYYYPSREINGREIERIEKYKERGFRLIERPCPAIGHQDMRTDLSCLAGQSAFDLFTYEEVDCAAFLKASSWNILIRVGEQFQAFHRTALIEYLKGHSTEFEGEMLYETPFKQTIYHPAIVWMAWSDYSIIQLVPCSTLHSGDSIKSIHTCRFYTVKDWATQSPGHIEHGWF